MDNNSNVIKYDNKQLTKVGNAIALTNKLLAISEPKLAPNTQEKQSHFSNAQKAAILVAIADIMDTSGLVIIEAVKEYLDNITDKKQCADTREFISDFLVENYEELGLEVIPKIEELLAEDKKTKEKMLILKIAKSLKKLRDKESSEQKQ